jgi:HPr Serine kinase C-terminal domain
MNNYKLYGLIAQSDWPLPECQPVLRDAAPDIHFIKGLVPEKGIDVTSDNPWEQSLDGEFWLNMEEVARYWIRHGREIIIEPYPGADDESIRLFLLGSALGALLFQRGLLLIHGNAIEVNGACLVCVGDSGAGKSTLAAAFLQHGHRLLADDVVPVDEQGLATPGFPRIKLWGNAARQFGIETDSLRRIMPDMDKYNVPLGERFCETPLPVKWVYVLDPSDEDEFACQPYEGMARFEPLHGNTYRVHFLEAMALKPQHLQQVARLAGNIRMARIRRPREGFRLNELVRFILDDVERHS